MTDKWDDLSTNANSLDKTVEDIKRWVRIGAVKIKKRKTAIKGLKPAVENALTTIEELEKLANSI